MPVKYRWGLAWLGLFLGTLSAFPLPRVPEGAATVLHQRFIERQQEVIHRLQTARESHPPQWIPARRRLRSQGVYTRGDTLFIRVVALRVEFQEDTTPLTTGNGRFRLTDNGEPPTLQDPETGCERPNPFYDPPHDRAYFEHQLEALAHWNFLATFGHVKIEWTVKPDGDTAAYRLPHPMTYYGDPENWYEGLLYLYRDALLVADQDSTLHFADYSRVIIFHAGSAWQTDYLGDSPYDIAAVTVLGYPIPVDEGQDTIWDASVLPETMSQDGIEVKLQSTLIHESMHNFYYAPDLYDTGYPPTGIGTGAWGIMCTGPYLGIPGQIPEGMIVPLPSAFERWWMDWAFRELYQPPLQGFLRPPLYQVLEPTTRPDTLTLLPSEILTDSLAQFLEDPYRGPRIYRIPINDHEYWLVESKLDNLPQNDSVGCGGDTLQVFAYSRDGVAVHFFGENDYLLPGKGILIWHVDSLILFQNWFTNTVQVPRPMAVDLEEADHVQDLEHWTDNLQYTLYGSPYDPWFRSNPNTFTPFSSPSSCDNRGAQTGVYIYGFSDPDTVMTFVLRQAFEAPGFPHTVYTSHQPGFVQAVDLDGDDTLEILVTSSIGLDSTAQYILEPPRIYALEPDLTPYGTGGPLKATLDPGFVVGEPAVGDLDHDGLAEIVVPQALNFQGWVSVYSATPGPQFTLRVRIPVNDVVLAAPMVLDSLFLFGDAHARLFVANLQGELVDTLQVGAPVQTTPALLSDGTLVFQSADALLYRWNLETGQVDTLLRDAFVVDTRTSPVVGQFAPDLPEAVAALTRDGTLHLVTPDGTVLWERHFDDRPRTDLAVGDLDQNGVQDFLWVGGTRLYAVDAYGNLFGEFPVTIADSLGQRISAPVIADVDPDHPGLEALCYVEGRGLVAVGPTGPLDDGFPWAVEDSVIHTPFIGDLDGPGPLPPVVLTLSAPGVLHGYLVPGGEVEWPGFAGGPEHQGRVRVNTGSPALPSASAAFRRVYLYPNPTYTGRTRLRAEIYGSGTARVELYAPSGKRLKTLHLTLQGWGMADAQPELDLSDLAPGVYWLKVWLRQEGGPESVKRLNLTILR